MVKTYVKRTNRACFAYFKLIGLILGALQTGLQGLGAVLGGGILKAGKILLIYCRSGAGCVLEDTELVGGDIPAILGGGFEIKLSNIFSAKAQLPLSLIHI